MDDFDDYCLEAGGSSGGGGGGPHGWAAPPPPPLPWQQPRRALPAAATGTARGAALLDDVLGGLGDGLMSEEDEEEEGDAEGQGREEGQEQEEDADSQGEADNGGTSEGGGGSDDDGRPRRRRRRRADDGGASDSGGSGGGYEGGSEQEVDPEDLVEADFQIDRSTVLSRIEAFVSDAVAAITAGGLPELELVSRAASNAHMVADDAAGPSAGAGWGGGSGGFGAAAGGGEVSLDGGGGSGSEGDEEQEGAGGEGGSGGEEDEEAEEGSRRRRRRRAQGGAAAGPARRLRLGSLTQVKSMTKGGGRQAHTVARVFRVLEAVHELLRSGRQATQRDLYYKLLGPPLFPGAAAVNGAIQDVVALLRVPRAALGIACSPRGAVCGALQLRDGGAGGGGGGAWIDCGALGMAGHPIPGELAAVERLSMRVSARYILVVEKDCIFQRLAEDRLPARLPLVMVTGKGNPDLATRAFLWRLCAAAPHVPVLGLVDWNPAGACILATYKFGNPRMGLEGTRFAVPRLRWLGVTGAMLADVPSSAFHALTRRDAALIAGLRRRLAGHRAWLDELSDMEERGKKCDIEALYSAGGFEGLHQRLARRILRQQYL